MNRLTLGVIAIGIFAAFFGGAAMLTNSPPNYSPVDAAPTIVAATGGIQEISIRALDTGRYDKQEIRVRKGVPVRVSFSADQYAGCGRLLVMPDFGVRLVVRGSETVTATFTPTQAGTYAYRCGMNMFRGRLIVE